MNMMEYESERLLDSHGRLGYPNSTVKKIGATAKDFVPTTLG